MRRGIIAYKDGGGSKVREKRPDYTVPGSKGNPLNKYCGISYKEAHRFFHLPANESFPCPDGENDCPYNLPCWYGARVGGSKTLKT
jgi:hypothetical protein